jgi:hypothetical protein
MSMRKHLRAVARANMEGTDTRRLTNHDAILLRADITLFLCGRVEKTY